jgi:glycine betaine/proline transport system ATP-binding protein
LPKLEVRNLTKVFGPMPKKVLKLINNQQSKEEIFKETGHNIGVRKASFEVEEGTIFVVMGLSGSGKSTLIRCLNRLIEPTEGEILIDGKNILTLNTKEMNEVKRDKLAMVFQSFALLPHRTIIDNVAFGLEIHGVKKEERRQKAKEILALVGLEGYEESMPAELSGGMQQRVGLARALAVDPDILLMDEAFSALDPLIRKQMQNELLTLQSKMQKTIIFITHDLDEALNIGDTIAIMKDGEIIQIGTAEEILSNPTNKYVRDFTENVNRAKVITASTIMKRTDVIVQAKDGVRSAIQKMKNASISSIYVLSKHRKLVGIVTIDDAMELLKTKKENLDIDDIIDTNVKTVLPDTPIEEIMPMFQESKYPIVVVDDNDKFMGIVFKASVISGILGGETDET